MLTFECVTLTCDLLGVAVAQVVGCLLITRLAVQWPPHSEVSLGKTLNAKLLLMASKRLHGSSATIVV